MCCITLLGCIGAETTVVLLIRMDFTREFTQESLYENACIVLNILLLKLILKGIVHL